MTAPTPIALDRYVVETLLPDLVGHDRRPSALLVYLVIAAATTSGRSAAMSHGELADRTGLSRRSIQAAVALLARRELIEVTRGAATETARYLALTPWRREGASMVQRGTARVSTRLKMVPVVSGSDPKTS